MIPVLEHRDVGRPADRELMHRDASPLEGGSWKRENRDVDSGSVRDESAARFASPQTQRHLYRLVTAPVELSDCIAAPWPRQPLLPPGLVGPYSPA